MSFYKESSLKLYSNSLNLTDHVSKKITSMISSAESSKKPVAREADSEALMAFLDKKYGKEMEAFCKGTESRTAAQRRMTSLPKNPLFNQIRNELKTVLDTIGKKVENLRANTSFSFIRESHPVESEEENEEQRDEDEEDFDEISEKNDEEESNGDMDCVVLLDEDDSTDDD